MSGGAADYAAFRLAPLFPAASITATAITITGNQTLGNITGTVNDGCVAGKTITGATLQLLIGPERRHGRQLVHECQLTAVNA